MIPADAPSAVHWNDRAYLLAGARHWLETRDRDYPRLIEDHKLAQALAVEKLERARCIVAQWLWVCDQSNPPTPAFGDHGMFGALNVDLAAEIAEAASVARYRADKRPADARHPFGYGREIYFYAFVVALMIFLGGGLFAVYEGIERVRHPEPDVDAELFGYRLPGLWVNVAILGFAIAAEGTSFFVAMRQFWAEKGKHSAVRAIRRSRPRRPT